MKFLKSILFFALLPVAIISCASTFELVRNPKNVLYVRTDGNDATAWYGTTNRAWSSITGAIAFAHSGDKIIVGVGNFTNTVSFIDIPSGVTISGLGTNNTFIYRSRLDFQSSNEVYGLTWDADGTAGGLFDAGNYCYFHDLVIKSTNLCVSTSGGVDSSGYNVWSNCVFVAQADGVGVEACTNYFYNCKISKTVNCATISSSLLFIDDDDHSQIYWSGGSIISTTNATSAGTNSVAVRLDPGTAGAAIHLQNTTISTPNGALDMYGVVGSTNYISNVTWSGTKTNAIATITTFGGFSNTNELAWMFQASWTVRVNTNNSFMLPAPPGS